ncbi:MAG: hypothetical protein QXS69_03845 [Candidatus Aenigmatarchaeota archaeon]
MNIFNLCKCKSSFLKIMFIFLAICILGFLIYLSYLAFESSQPTSIELIEKNLQLTNEEDIKDGIEKTFNITPYFAKGYHFIYKDVDFEVLKIIFVSENDAHLFIDLLKKYTENFNTTPLIETLDTKNNLIIYKVLPPEEYAEKYIGKILQKNETVFMFFGYTNREDYLKDVIRWFTEK